MPVFFYGEKRANGAFSNFSPHPIVDHAGRRFPTGEHYFHYRKALLFGDHVTALQILYADTPLAAKKLGAKVVGFDQVTWDANREVIMFDTVALKARQHPEVRDLLLGTGDNIIAEAAPLDRIWGIGVGAIRAAEMAPDTWPGLNLLGAAWMKVRAEEQN